MSPGTMKGEQAVLPVCTAKNRRSEHTQFSFLGVGGGEEKRATVETDPDKEMAARQSVALANAHRLVQKHIGTVSIKAEGGRK